MTDAKSKPPATTAAAQATPAAVRRFQLQHAAAVACITAQSPEAAAWPATEYATNLADGAHGWVVLVGESVEGYLLARTVSDECEILTLAVSRAFRRQGLGSRLVAEALEFAERSGSRRCYIEVRGSNQGAIEFYRRHGFTECGRRGAYYRNPPEDALLMVRIQNPSL